MEELRNVKLRIVITEQLVELLQRGGAKVLSDLPRTIPSTV